MSELLNHIRSLLQNDQPRELILTEVLRAALEQFHSETGTIHRLDPEKQLLHLVAQIGLPPQMLEVVTTIPVGKGIAGQTVAQNKPVTICNLQTDTSGVARPGARQSGVGGALCAPMRNNGKILGTIGVGTVRQYEYSPEETKLLEEIGKLIGSHVTQTSSNHS